MLDKFEGNQSEVTDFVELVVSEVEDAEFTETSQRVRETLDGVLTETEGL